MKDYKTRSNRPLTEFACDGFDRFAESGRSLPYKRVNGNTTIEVLPEDTVNGDRCSVFVVSLFGSPIFEARKTSDGIDSLKIAFTDFFDVWGQPTTTTAERLNGLLDRAGNHEVIPKNVRVFRCKAPEASLTYIGRGEERVAVGRQYVKAVAIQPDPNDLKLLHSPV
jgi:hypothetical protein